MEGAGHLQAGWNGLTPWLPSRLKCISHWSLGICHLSLDGSECLGRRLDLAVETDLPRILISFDNCSGVMPAAMRNDQ